MQNIRLLAVCVKMCSLTEVNNPEDRVLDWRPQNRNMSFINVVCLMLSLISTAISIGGLVIYRTDSSNAAQAGGHGSINTASTIGPEPELKNKVKIFQGLKHVTKTSSKLEWQGGSSGNVVHNITETGDYFVYAQVAFKGGCSEANLLLKTTLCKKQWEREKELLVTSMTVCENMNRTEWTRTLSQAAIFYFEEGDDIYIKTTTMEYVDFYHHYKNIFGIYRL